MEKQADPQFRRHDMHQAPRECPSQRAAVEGVFLREVQEHQPSGVVDIPAAIPAPVRNGSKDGVLQRATIERGVNASLS